MITDRLALEIARLALGQEASVAGALQRVVDLATRTVPGCVGSTATRWAVRSEDPAEEATVGTHPALAELLEFQHARHEGPSYDAVRLGHAVASDDILIESRWPWYTAAALRRGVRCLATTPYTDDHTRVTVTLYGIRPGALDLDQMPLASLLAAQGGAVAETSTRFDDVNRTAVQLREAVESRAVVDQACGILMHALGCDVDAAFEELRRISQTRHVKLTALARRIVAGGTTERVP